MSGSKIEVCITLDHRAESICVCKILDTYLVGQAFRELDYPEVGADPVSQILCTPPPIISQVLQSRAETAARISAELTQAILEIMEHDDTIMGRVKIDGTHTPLKE